MAKPTFSKLNLKLNKQVKELVINDVTLEIQQYLPQQEKSDFTKYVLANALDEKTGCFSPIRLETYFGIAVVRWYAGVSFTEKQLAEAPKSYDLLESNGVIRQICELIPEEEYQYIQDIVYDTAADMAKFNTSFAGMISTMSGEANSINEQLGQILNKIKNKEGLEELAVIKDIVGKKD